MKLYTLLKTIYINRYRRLTYKDASSFWIPILIYLIIIYKLLTGSINNFPQLDVRPYVLISFVFSICGIISNRKDINLIKSIFFGKKTFFVLFCDLLIANSLNIFTAIYTNQFFVLLIIIALIIVFTFIKNTANKPFIKNVFYLLDYQNVEIFRKYKMYFLVFFFCYFLSYQGLTERNFNLYSVGILLVIFFMIGNTTKSENLKFYILSRLNERQYIIKNEIAVFKNCCIALLPVFVLAIIFNYSYLLKGFAMLLLIPCVFPSKYIIFNIKMAIGLLQTVIYCIILTFYFSDLNFIYVIPVSLLVTYVMHKIAFKKFRKEIIKSDTEFYL